MNKCINKLRDRKEVQGGEYEIMEGKKDRDEA